MYTNLSCDTISRLADPFGRLADGAHEPVLYLLPKQNRELPYASSVGASRVKYKLKKELSRWYKVKGHKKSSLLSVGGLRQRYHRPSWLKILMPMNHEFVTVLPQTFRGASGQMTLKMLLQPNGPVVWGVAVCVRVGMRFCKVPVGGRSVSRPD